MSAIIQSGKGDVFGPTGGVADGDLAVYNGTSGKIIKGSSNTINSPTITRFGASYRPSGVLINSIQQTIQNTVGVTNIWSYTLPAGSLSKDGDILRCTFHAVFGGSGAVTRGARIIVGGATAYDLAYAGTTQLSYFVTVMIGRISSTQLRFAVGRTMDNANAFAELATIGSLNFAADLVFILQIYVNTVTGGTASTHYMSALEFLPIM